jgi:hypothetical protein
MIQGTGKRKNFQVQITPKHPGVKDLTYPYCFFFLLNLNSLVMNYQN